MALYAIYRGGFIPGLPLVKCETNTQKITSASGQIVCTTVILWSDVCLALLTVGYGYRKLIEWLPQNKGYAQTFDPIIINSIRGAYYFGPKIGCGFAIASVGYKMFKNELYIIDFFGKN